MKQVFSKKFILINNTADTIQQFDTIEEAFQAGEASKQDYYLAKAIDVAVQTTVVVKDIEVDQPAPADQAAASDQPAAA